MEFDIIRIMDKRDLDYYIDDIMALQDYVDKALKEDFWYIQTSRDEVYSLFENNGILLLALYDDRISAVSIAGDYHADAEMVKQSGIPLNTSKCLYFDCVFVDPKDRGKRLQQQLMEETIRIAKKIQYKCTWCMVCPDNVYSIRNIEALGYKKIGEIVHNFSGWKRNVMFRKIM